MNKFTFTLLFALLFSISLNAQVKTTIFKTGKAFNMHKQLQKVSNTPVFNIPKVNTDSVEQIEAELDRQGVGRPFRFGTPIETNITMEQGIWIQKEKNNNYLNKKVYIALSKTENFINNI